MRKLLITLVICFIALPAAAQWRRGGLFGADVRALIADPQKPDTLYLGTSSGEVYVSEDGARSWRTPRRGVPFPGYIVDNLVIDRNGRLWAACWGLWGGGVVAISEDGGRSWRRRDAGLEDFSVRAIAIDNSDADYVLLGGLSGVHRSLDGGETWEKISDQINVESLAIDPRMRDRIYVGTWRQGMRTEDGGKNWKLINNGMVLDTDMFSITIEPENPDSLWVSTCGWVYNTENRGDKWTRFRDGFNNRRIHDIEIDPCNRETLYAGSVGGLYRSEDRGKSWYAVSEESLVINSVVLHPQRPARVILGVEGDGVYVSHDNAKTFTRASEGLYNLRIATMVADPLVKERVYAAVLFGGTASGVYRSDDAGKTWAKVSKTALPEVLSLIVSPDQSTDVRFVAGTEKGFFWSSDAMEWHEAAPANTALRVNKVLRFSNVRLFAATADGVFTSRDGGKSWYRLAAAWSRTVDIAVGSVGGSRVLFALTDDGVTLFDGQRWRAIEGAPPSGRTIAIRGDVLFVAGSHGVKAGRIGGDLRWTAAAAPDAQSAAVFGAARHADQFLFLTSRQQREILFGSSGGEWLSMELPTHHTEITAVTPDAFEPTRFYIGTLGGGVFIFEGRPGKYVVKKPAGEVAPAAGGQ